jgi:hypothetical protein
VGEDVEADLTADGKGQFEVLKLFSHRLDHGLSDPVGLATSASRRDSFRGTRTRSYFSKSFRSSVEAFRPIGETLTMPRRNSMNVPLVISSGGGAQQGDKTDRLMGMSSSERYRKIQLASFLYSSSPTYWMNELLLSSLPSLYAVNPFSPNA